MLDIQKNAVTKLVSILNGIEGATYKIILPDGSQYGGLEVAPERKAPLRRASAYPMGELANYFRPLIADMKPGDVVAIPYGKYVGETLRGALSAWCCAHWGKGTVNTALNHKTSTVEILRTE